MTTSATFAVFSVGACLVQRLTTIYVTAPGSTGKMLENGTVITPKILSKAVIIPTAAEAAAPFVVPRFQMMPPSSGTSVPESIMV